MGWEIRYFPKTYTESVDSPSENAKYDESRPLLTQSFSITNFLLQDGAEIKSTLSSNEWFMKLISKQIWLLMR